MGRQVVEIEIPKHISDHYEVHDPLNSLEGIKRLNVFIGPNNSGKSRLLRSLFLESGALRICTDHPSAIKTHAMLRQLHNLEIDKSLELLAQCRQAFENVSAFQGIGQPLLYDRRHIEQISPMVAQLSRVSSSKTYKPFFELCSGVQKELLALSGESQPQNGVAPERPLEKSNFIYIPTLRGMRAADRGKDSRYLYFDRTYSDYIKPFREQHRAEKNIEIEAARIQHQNSVVTGLEFFETVTSRLLGDYIDRRNIREFEQFLSDVFFPQKRVTLIPRQGKDSLYVQIGKERERPIQELGDGIQQLIILTFPLFENRDSPLFLFIEEPDLFLHPGYQRVFIDAVRNATNPDLYVFVTTHSSQFVDATIDQESCAVFRCEKIGDEHDAENYDPKFKVTRSPFGERGVLTDIGVRPSSVMFANCTLWVEGIYDRLYLRKYLEILMADRNVKFVENLHYAFVEYGGNNITHWSFLDESGPRVDWICSTLFLISDHDFNKDDRHDRLRTTLGDRFYPLEAREIENLLTAKVVLSVIKEYEKERYDGNVQNFTEADYKDVPLGEFIDAKVLVDLTKSLRYRGNTCYKDSSGTIKDKGKFCERALNAIRSKEDMGEEAIRLTGMLLEFIDSHNR